MAPFPAATIRFSVTDEMVAAFAALSGDHSSLHVDDAFARRSAYRRPVVHGMLPVSFLAAAVPPPPIGRCWMPTALTGRFLAPVFAGDRLRLTLTPVSVHGDLADNREFTYAIVQEGSEAETTSGTLTLAAVSPPAHRGSPRRTAESILTGPAKVNAYTLEQIEAGATDGLDLEMTAGAAGAFLSLLALGLRGEEGRTTGKPVGLWIPNLLAILSLSTSVGVSLPGASATFLDFSASCPGALEFDTVCRLSGTVTHRSRATRIIKKQVTVAAGSEVVLSAKVSALVNEAPRAMPTSAELKQQAAADWGLAGKVALVTGASRGIGETTAKLLALCGATVVVNYHRGVEDATRVAEEIRAAGGDCSAVAADVSDAAQVRRMMAQVVERHGTVDVLVNNAARDFRPAPFLELTWEDVQRDLDVIAKGAFLCCQEVIPMMLRAGGGKIVNISSVATDNPPPDQTKYVMAKSALVGLTRSLSIEFAPKNIQVNLVAPNFVETDLVAHVQEGFRAKLAQQTPMRRHASAVDVARAVVFLASSFASFTTGQKVMVTGGGAPYV